MRNPFEDFEEKAQWIMFVCGLSLGFLCFVLSILIVVPVYLKIGILHSVAIGLGGFLTGGVLAVVGYAGAMLHVKLSVLANNIDLQLRKADKEKQQIAAALETIIALSKQDELLKRIRKSLNGVVQILSAKGLEDRNLRWRVLHALTDKLWRKSICVSSYGLPGDWMDPYWFSYLSLQIGRAAELKQHNVRAKRYFIYEKKVVEDYIDELAVLVEAHDDYVQPFLYFRKEIEGKLKDKGLSVTDFTYIEYDDNDEIILWRDPEEKGEVEEITDERKPLIKELMKVLESEEKNLDRKGILTT